MKYEKAVKRIISAAVAVSMVAGLTVSNAGAYIGIGSTVNAAESTAEAPASDFNYLFNTDDTISITKYKGTAENVVIPSKINNRDVTFISFAFDGNKTVKSVVIPETVREIGTQAFHECTELTSVSIAKGVVTIGDNAFSGCEKLDNVKIPDSVINIGNWAFCRCKSLKNLVIPDSIEIVGDGAFRDTPWYDNLPDGIVYVGKAVYKYKGEMPLNTKITLKENTTSISQLAFYGYGRLKEITLPATLRSMEGQVFTNTGLENIYVDENNEYYSSLDGVLFNKDKTTIVCYPGGRTGSYTIPKGVTEIGNAAFARCTGLTDVKIPDTVKTIDVSAFEHTYLTDIVIPDSVESIEDFAFYYSSLQNVTFGKNLKKIEYSAFCGCGSLKSADIPDSVTYIGVSAFKDCNSLTSVTISDKVTSIGESAFVSCNKLEKIDVNPENEYYTSENGVLFNKDKTKLISYPAAKRGAYVIPNTVTEMSYNAFEDCAGLTYIVIPNTIKTIKGYTFRNCTGLKRVEIPDGVEMIDFRVFEHCDNLKLAVIPNSVKEIADSAFQYCNVTIYGYENSVAQNYAEQQNLKFIIMPTNTSTISASSVVVGEKVTINGLAENGAAPYSYSYRCYKFLTFNDIFNIDYSSNISLFEFQPQSSGVYFIEVKAKDSNGITAEKTLTLSVKDALLDNTSTISSDIITKGDSININLSAKGGKPAYYYAVSTKYSTDSDWTVIKDYNTDSVSSVNWTPAKTGTYKVCIKVKDSSAKGKEVAEYYTVTVNNVLANSSTISRTTITKGDSVTLTGKATGGISPYQYAFFVKHSTAKGWTTIQSYDSTATKLWKPAKTGTYQVCAKVKDSKGTVSKKYFTLTVKEAPLANNSTIGSTTITKGNSVTLTGKATGGKAPYTYAYYYKKTSDKSWKTAKDWSNTTSVSIKPAYATTYDVCIKVKDSNGTVAKKYFTLTVKEAPLSNNSTISSTAINKGDSVTLTGKATGGKAPYTYAYYYKKTSDKSWKTAKDWSNTTSVSIKPAYATTYDVCIKVKDSNGTIARKYFTVNVKAPLANSSTISKT